MSITFCLIALFLIEYPILSYTKGVLIYPLDNSYLSMAIAKNLAIHGTWGLSGQGFVPSTSSILYPIILASFFKIFGAQAIIPIIINLAAGMVLLWVVQKWLIRHAVSPGWQLLILLAMVLLIPLPVLVAIGMEHTLQILFNFLFLYTLSEELAKWNASPGAARRLSPRVYVYGILVTMIRYEGIFLVLMACIFLLVYRKWLLSGLLILISSLPILIFGIYSLQKGAYFFPNSVLLKSNFLPNNWDEVWTFLKKGMFDRIFYAYPTFGTVAIQRIFILLPLFYLLFHNQVKKSPAYRNILLFLTGLVLLHIVFANTMWFYRYEAYLLALWIPVTGALIAGARLRNSWTAMGRRRWMAIFLCLILVWPVFLRGKTAFEETPRACISMYKQDYQLGNFLKRYYDGQGVAMNDMGAVAFLTTVNGLDLYGIGTTELAKAKRDHFYKPEFLQFLIERGKVKIVAVSTNLYNPVLLEHWTMVASWEIGGAIPPADNNLSFFAVEKADAAALAKNLRAYESELPAEVKISYY